MCGRKPVLEDLKEVDRILETPFSVTLTSANFVRAQTESSQWHLVVVALPQQVFLCSHCNV